MKLKLKRRTRTIKVKALNVVFRMFCCNYHTHYNKTSNRRSMKSDGFGLPF